MLKKLLLAAFALTLVCTSQTWAGSTANGTPQKTKPFGFCFAGNPNVTYFSKILTLTPTTSIPNLRGTYADYIQKTYGLPSIDREQCITADSSASAGTLKKQYKAMVGTRKVVDTQWAANSPATHP